MTPCSLVPVEVRYIGNVSCQRIHTMQRRVSEDFTAVREVFDVVVMVQIYLGFPNRWLCSLA